MFQTYFKKYLSSPLQINSPSPFTILFLWGTLLCANLTIFPPISQAQEEMEDLLSLSFEELAELTIYSASKKEQALEDTSSSVFVITSEDIRRSTATSIPELLRMVPGIQVARFNANTWSVSMRGFNSRFSNKLLVLLDGRSVYSPLFSGVYWNEIDTLLEDIERIEVVRGPGGTLWGSNAVNGVINIITKHSQDTTGTLVSFGGGTEEQGFLSARAGVSLQSNAWLRTFAKIFDRDDSKALSGGDADDKTQVGRAGFRSDWALDENNALSIHGDIYKGDERQEFLLSSSSLQQAIPVSGTGEFNGGSLLSTWEHDTSNWGAFRLQGYYARTEREDPLTTSQQTDTFDLEAEHRFNLGSRHELVWGIGARHIEDELIGSDFTLYNPRSRSNTLLNAFVQDEIVVLPELLFLTVGTKIEHNEYTGAEFQPSAKLLWKPSSTQSVWASYSRAVRIPSRGDNDTIANLSTFPLPSGGAGLVRVIGSTDIESENLSAYELGYRQRLSNHMQLDLSAFAFDYDDLRALELGEAGVDLSSRLPLIVSPVTFTNDASALSWGADAYLSFLATRFLRLHAGYSYLSIDMNNDAGKDSIIVRDENMLVSHHQFVFRSLLNITEEIEFDSMLRYADRISTPDIPSYIELDLRFAWKPSEQLEFAVIGNNLLDQRHPEFQEAPFSPLGAEIERGVFGKLTWRF